MIQFLMPAPIITPVYFIHDNILHYNGKIIGAHIINGVIKGVCTMSEVIFMTGFLPWTEEKNFDPDFSFLKMRFTLYPPTSESNLSRSVFKVIYSVFLFRDFYIHCAVEHTIIIIIPKRTVRKFI